MWSHGSIADSRPGQLCSGAYGALSVGRDLSALTDQAAFSLSFQHNQIHSATGAAAVSH